MSSIRFDSLSLIQPIQKALKEEGYETATPIQAQAIPHGIAGKDVLGVAQTGTGKTAAFAIPMIQRFAESRGKNRGPRGLVLAPTRELAQQIGDSFNTYGRHTGLRTAVVFGGVGFGNQTSALRRGVDVLVACPGRLLDLLNQGHADLSNVEVLVLDEADRMLDMGFIHDIRRLVAKMPTDRQTLFFSATMPDEIRRLSATLLKHPVTVTVSPVASTAERVEQCVYLVSKENKPALLAHLVRELPMTRAIVFTRTKHGADKVVKKLTAAGIRSEAIHGNKRQNHRERALSLFSAGKVPVLVATDIASRGIDVDDVTHVVNYDVTHEPEVYVHRIGRTARAGASGNAVSFCDTDERSNLRAIERLTKQQIPVIPTPPLPRAEPSSDDRDRERAPQGRDNRGQQGGGRRPAQPAAGGGRQGAPAGKPARTKAVGGGVRPTGAVPAAAARGTAGAGAEATRPARTGPKKKHPGGKPARNAQGHGGHGGQAPSHRGKSGRNQRAPSFGGR